MSSTRNAQVWKTLLWVFRRDLFLDILYEDIRKHARKARKLGFTCAVRLNGTSDIDWFIEARGFMDAFRDVQFYDYTKDINRAVRHKKCRTRWHLTVSRSENTPNETIDYLISQGINVAVVFNGKVLPTSWRGHRVVDGDATDYRPNDPEGVIVGLSAKGHVRDKSGFFV